MILFTNKTPICVVVIGMKFETFMVKDICSVCELAYILETQLMDNYKRVLVLKMDPPQQHRHERQMDINKAKQAYISGVLVAPSTLSIMLVNGQLCRFMRR